MPMSPNPPVLPFHLSEHRNAARRQEDRRLLRRDRELEAARRISEALFEHLHTDELVKRALHTALEEVNAESGSILLADPDSKQQIFRHSIGSNPVRAGTAIPWEKGIAGAVFHSGQAIVIGDVNQDHRYFPEIDILTHHVTRDLIALPLKRWEGQPVGVLEVLNKREGRLDEDDLALLTIISAITASSIEQARLFQEARLAEVARILGDVSHDIKNLLMPVVCGAGYLQDELNDLFASLLDREIEQARKSHDLCNEVIVMLGNSTRRIQDRVKEIADCVKGLSTPPDFTSCRLVVVVESVVQTLRWVAEEKGITITIEGLTNLPQILGDESRLFNAFYNLINNAIPEMPSGGSIKISGKESPETKGIQVWVSDTGRGMSLEVCNSLFTLHTKSQKIGGTGLGTKIVKDVIDAHGGQISVESEVGVGTTFCINLPLCPPINLNF